METSLFISPPSDFWIYQYFFYFMIMTSIELTLIFLVLTDSLQITLIDTFVPVLLIVKAISPNHIPQRGIKPL
jgi:hypothetical protein